MNLAIHALHVCIKDKWARVRQEVYLWYASHDADCKEEG